MFDRHGQQCLGPHGLDIAGFRRDQPDRPRRWRGRDGFRRPQSIVDDMQGVPLDPGADRVDLQRMREVIGEEHHHRQTGEQQRDRAADREPRELPRTFAISLAHGVQAGRAVGERGNEDTEGDLVRTIAQEIPNQPRRELRRRELQRHDCQPQNERDDGDDGAGDVAQQVPCVAGGALVGQRRQPRTGADIDQRDAVPHQQSEQAAAHGQHPERTVHVLADRCAIAHCEDFTSVSIDSSDNATAAPGSPSSARVAVMTSVVQPGTRYCAPMGSPPPNSGRVLPPQHRAEVAAGGATCSCGQARASS